MTDRVLPHTKNASNLLSSPRAGKKVRHFGFLPGKITLSERSHACTHTCTYPDVSVEKEMEEKIFFSARLIDYKVNFN